MKFNGYNKVQNGRVRCSDITLLEKETASIRYGRHEHYYEKVKSRWMEREKSRKQRDKAREK